MGLSRIKTRIKETLVNRRLSPTILFRGAIHKASDNEADNDYSKPYQSSIPLTTPQKNPRAKSCTPLRHSGFFQPSALSGKSLATSTTVKFARDKASLTSNSLPQIKNDSSRDGKGRASKDF